MRTLEAVVDQSGEVTFLSKVRLKQKRRALVTILDEEPRFASTPAIQEPTYEPVDEAELLALFADREESAMEIARRIREANRKIT